MLNIMNRSFVTDILRWGCGALLLVSCSAPSQDENLSTLIPEPVEVKSQSGRFELDCTVGVAADDESFVPAIAYLEDFLPVPVEEVPVAEADIRIDRKADMAEGAYHLVIGKKGIRIESSDYQGVASALATVRQLLPAVPVSGKLQLPAVEISDSPRFQWRGMHLDVSRHFYDKEEVKLVLDRMAQYKLNKFHWHLTDDQVWRIEIKKYPLLTEKGACRELNGQDKECLRREVEESDPSFRLPEDKLKTVDGKTIYGGYYTQDDIREVVAYAALRGIDVIPEIDMPGHFLAAIDQYPEVTCKGQKGWGAVFSSPVCVGNDEAVTFCKNVWKEVFDLFPYEYAHIGGDEVDKANWKRCPACRTRVQAEGLQDADALQAWFIREMETFFHQNGKKLMGWDEILEDGLTDQSAISWWRSWVPDAVQRATAKGMKTVICPGSHLYFDAQQDARYLSRIYEWEPMPEGMTPEQEALVMGLQCNVWTEWIPTMDRMEYMTFPRLLAASEVAWRRTGKEKDYPAFQQKIFHHLARMDETGIHYRIPDLTGFVDKSVFVDHGILEVQCPLESVAIRYTTDGRVPEPDDPLYTGPIPVDGPVDFALRAFRPDGTGDQIFRTSFRKETYLPASDLSGKVLEDGLKVDWYDFHGDSCAAITQAPFKRSFITRKVEIPEEAEGNIGLILTGFIDIPADDIYTFSLFSDDGSRLWIDDQEIINNDGLHSPESRAAQKALRAGLHPFKVAYFDWNGGVLELSCRDKDGSYVECPESWFKHLAVQSAE